jgi:hypothetical protein
MRPVLSAVVLCAAAVVAGACPAAAAAAGAVRPVAFGRLHGMFQQLLCPLCLLAGCLAFWGYIQICQLQPHIVLRGRIITSSVQCMVRNGQVL